MYPNQAAPPQEHPKKQSAEVELFGKISKNVNNVAASLRILEERYSNLRNRSQVSEQSTIELEKEVTKDIKMLTEELIDLKRGLSDIKEKLGLISAEMTNLVNKNEFKVMERYLDMWQPMNFVTRNELNKLLEQKEKEIQDERKEEITQEETEKHNNNNPTSEPTT